MQVVPEAYVLKWSILVVQRLALHQNGVEFHQQSIGDIRIRIKVFGLPTHIFTKSCMEAGTLPKIIGGPRLASQNITTRLSLQYQSLYPHYILHGNK